MNRVSSCTSYNEFRKKNLQLYQTSESNLSEITKLAMELESFHQDPKPNNQRYEPPNKIKEEIAEEDSFSPLFKYKKDKNEPMT